MKKFVLSLVSLTALAACSGYDYYEADLRYRQSGSDCIYYYNEGGSRFNEEIRSLKDAKKIVYRDTICRDLYTKDTFGQPKRNDRKVVVPAVSEEPKMPTCGCNKCAKRQVLKNRFVIVPAFEG